MDAFAKPRARTEQLFDLWRKVLADHTDIPILHCIGNHDIWGWNRKDSGTTGSEPRWGKQWAMDAFGLAKPYYALDRGGWHLIVLDSTFPHGDDYTARLDDEQFEFLRSDLAAVPPATPVLVLSHIPILSACAYFDGENETSGNWTVPGSWMHIDARRIKDLFFKHPNVKLALSGHIHLVDRVDYLGVTYLCNGAVSAGWWKGPNQECVNGYGVVDLYDTGRFEARYQTFDWTPRP
jgi:3',5'-cyclic AMP phosphodiesterase CpdA